MMSVIKLPLNNLHIHQERRGLRRLDGSAAEYLCHAERHLQQILRRVSGLH